MILTPKQEQGLKIAVERYNNHEPYTVIAGYAGTGKSTLVRFIVDTLQLDPTKVSYASFTGKAAQVLRLKGCPNAKTVHRLLYDCKYNQITGQFYFRPKEHLNHWKLIIVDEVSMLPKELWDLLLSYHRPIIAIGDPAQLPPVMAENCGVLDHPHIFLDEVVRQAQDNEIIRLTMKIRNGETLPLYRGKTVRIVDRKELGEQGFFGWADQILVGKNKSRIFVNNIIRQSIWSSINKNEAYNLEPQVGDKIICLHNYWDIVNETNDALVNGMIGYINNIYYDEASPYMDKTPHITFMPEYDDSAVFPRTKSLEVDYKLFMEHKPTVSYGKDGNYLQMSKLQRLTQHQFPLEFDYAYAITTHKAQGSEWDKVIVLEEHFQSATKENHQKWLYTAATRASEKLILVKDFYI